jgi:phage terminase Nu1 subunit (DNA packaging protein)
VDVTDVPPVLWSISGAAGMFAGLFWMLATGRMLTRSQHAEIVKDKNETIAFQRQTITVLTKATQDLAVPAHTASYALHQLEKRADEKAGDES